MRLTLILLTYFTLQITAQSQDCSCSRQFQFFEEKIRLNYAGFNDKVTPANQSAYEAYTQKYLAMADTASTEKICYNILTEWKKWFKDGHVQLRSNTGNKNENPDLIRARYAASEQIPMSESQAKNYLSQSGLQPVEGIWRSAEGNYKVAIVRQPNQEREFAAIILKADSIYWTPGQIKFDLHKTSQPNVFSCRYYMRDHSLNSDTISLTNGILHFSKLGSWYMEYPKQAIKPRPKGIFTLSMLDSTTALLTIPTMDESVRKELDSLMIANKTLLGKTPNLIIDCRGNGGGSDITYRLVTPLLYTNRTTAYRNQVWATRDNAGKYADLHKDKNYPWSTRAYGGYMQRRINRNLGKFIGKKGIAKNKKEKKQPCPIRVAVLIDGNCASSCESFVEVARQSKKVTLIGVNSAGVSDYGNLHTLPFPCGNFQMAYPTTRSSAVDAGKGIDNIGFPPDIRLDNTTKDWVEYARQYLKSI